MSATLPQDVAYRFAVDRRPEYLHVSVTGENTVANVRRILRDVLCACAEHGCARVLLEEHLTGPSLGTVDVFEIVAEGSHAAVSALEQMAYVDTNPEHDASQLEFIETVAVNRGIRVRVFATVAEAEAWLAAPPAR
jgi:hypothetical protein